MTGSAPPQRRRTKRLVAAIGLATAGVLLGVFALQRDRLLEEWHVWRLKRDPQVLLERAGESLPAVGSPRRRALERYLQAQEARQRLLSLYLNRIKEEAPQRLAPLERYLTDPRDATLRWWISGTEFTFRLGGDMSDVYDIDILGSPTVDARLGQQLAHLQEIMRTVGIEGLESPDHPGLLFSLHERQPGADSKEVADGIRIDWKGWRDGCVLVATAKPKSE